MTSENNENCYTLYRNFIQEFAATINPNDQLPIRISGYLLKENEIYGEAIDWAMSYLTLPNKCPTTLRTYIITTVLKRILEKIKCSPKDCGFEEERNIYQPLKLVRVVTSEINDLVMELLSDNSKLYDVPPPPESENAVASPKTSVAAIKNSRRTMEDRHVIIDDFNKYFNVLDSEPTFYYAIFDGHNGQDAATYSNSHLHYNIASNPNYPVNIEQSIREAFCTTDLAFIRKAKIENLCSGTTALCALYRKLEKKLFIGWAGDSQALIARQGKVRQLVKKHSASDPDERERIQKLGGVVMHWMGTYRVNGSLAISRAIGDSQHKPFVTAEPDMEVLDLDGEEDFLVLGCDGLWDTLTEDDVAITVYTEIKNNPDNYQNIAKELCDLAKSQGSSDNISVIVVYLKEPHLIATQSWPPELQTSANTMENYENIEPALVPPMNPTGTIDALGNTNQDIFDVNPFGDFNTRFNGKVQEITDIVMQQQQSANDFCNNIMATDTAQAAAQQLDAVAVKANLMLNNENNQNDESDDNFTSNLNNLNNNKLCEMDDDVVMVGEPAQPAQQASLITNDTNNNSNNQFDADFGPETDVDAIEPDDEFEFTAGEKEKAQFETKETEDLTDRGAVNIHDSANPFDGAGIGQPAAVPAFGSFENKIFEELSLHNPDLIKGNNPFTESSEEPIDNMMVPNEYIDNKLIDNLTDEMSCDKSEELQPEVDFTEKKDFGFEREDFAKEVISDVPQVAADLLSTETMEVKEEVEVDVKQQTQDLGITDNVVADESGAEDSEDDWNYIEGDKKIVEETPEEIEKEEKEFLKSEATEKEEETVEIATPVEEFKQEEPAVVEEPEQKVFEQELTQDLNAEALNSILEKELIECNDQVEIQQTEIHQEEFESNEPQSEQPEPVEESVVQEEIKKESQPIETPVESEEIPQESDKQEVAEEVKENNFQTPVEDIELRENSYQEEKEIVEEKQIEKSEEIEDNSLLEEEEDDIEVIAEQEIQEIEKLDDNMESQLNPDAKEFVPISPHRSPCSPSSPFQNGVRNPLLAGVEDDIIAQSPRKPDQGSKDLENFVIPSEKEFDLEVQVRPHELEVEENGHAVIPETEESGAEDGAINLKEAMQKDDKLDYEYKDEKQTEDFQKLEYPEGSFEHELQLQEQKFLANKIEDPMNRSFYEGRDDDILEPKPVSFIDNTADLLNTVQDLPVDDEDLMSGQPEVDQVESDIPEADLLQPVVEPIVQAAKEVVSEVSDLLGDFEVSQTQIAEDVKAADNLLASGLSPEAPEFNPTTVQTVEETQFESKQIFEEVKEVVMEELTESKPLMSPEPIVHDIPEPVPAPEVKSDSPVASPPPTPANEEVLIEKAKTPEPTEIVEKLAENLQELKVEDSSPVVEAVALAGAAAAVTAVAATAIVADKKKSTPVKDAKKPEVKATKAAPKSQPVPTKRVTSSTATKPAPSATAKTTTMKSTTSSAPKPSTASKSSSAMPGSRTTAPKTATSRPTSAPVKKPVSSTEETKPTPAVRKTTSTTTVTAKKPLSSVTTKTTTVTKTASAPRVGVSATKPSTTTTTTIQKSLAKPPTTSTTSRVGVSPKPKTLSTSLQEKKTATSPTKPVASRPIGSASDKTNKDATNKQVLSRTTATKPAPKTTTTSSVLKKSLDVKSPTSAAAKPLSSVGARKPLSSPTTRTTTTTVKKSPTSATGKTTTTTITKKSPTKTAVSKKTTTTTTVTEKKIVNGDVVKDETKTEIIEQVMNGKNELHGFSNGFKDDGQEKVVVHENGGSEQQVNTTNMIIIDSTTD